MSDTPNDPAQPEEDRLDTVPTEEVDDMLLDLDPNDVIEVYPDFETDTDEDPANDEDHPYEPEDVPGAAPVDPSFADATIPSAEDEISDDGGEG